MIHANLWVSAIKLELTDCGIKWIKGNHELIYWTTEGSLQKTWETKFIDEKDSLRKTAKITEQFLTTESSYSMKREVLSCVVYSGSLATHISMTTTLREHEMSSLKMTNCIKGSTSFSRNTWKRLTISRDKFLSLRLVLQKHRLVSQTERVVEHRQRTWESRLEVVLKIQFYSQYYARHFHLWINSTNKDCSQHNDDDEDYEKAV